MFEKAGGAEPTSLWSFGSAGVWIGELKDPKIQTPFLIGDCTLFITYYERKEDILVINPLLVIVCHMMLFIDLYSLRHLRSNRKWCSCRSLNNWLDADFHNLWLNSAPIITVIEVSSHAQHHTTNGKTFQTVGYSTHNIHNGQNSSTVLLPVSSVRLNSLSLLLLSSWYQQSARKFHENINPTFSFSQEMYYKYFAFICQPCFTWRVILNWRRFSGCV